MSINWDNLRSWNGTVNGAFEELCSQLAVSEAAPTGSRFFRKGTPDAGVECFWQLPDSQEWAWQAKWFRFSPTPNQWQQIDKSVNQALGKHPNLTKYTVCLPLNRSDGREDEQESFLDKWNARVISWQAKAEQLGMTVTFDFWGESEIGGRLSDERHRGRHWFWFNEERFSSAWFNSRVNEAVENARDRYTEDLNVDLPLRNVFESLGRTPEFVQRLSEMYSNAKIALEKIPSIDNISSYKNHLEEIHVKASSVLTSIQPWVLPQTDFIEWSINRLMPWQELGTELRQLEVQAMECISELSVLRDQRKRDHNDPHDRSNESLGYAISRLFKFHDAISEMGYYFLSDECRLSNLPALLLTGDAGLGKTHLLCHVAKTDTKAGRARVLFHGEHFKDGEPWFQMIQLMGLKCSREEFLGALEAAAQATNTRVLILIDALNEGDGNRLWRKFLSGILSVVGESTWLGICVTVRTTYEDLIVPESLDKNRLIRVFHEGFADLAWEATTKFFQRYEIEPSTPLLFPEFYNPLFLKLFCLSIKNAGLTRVPDGLTGITAVFQFFIKSIDKKLSSPEFLNYDRRTPYVAVAIEKLAGEMAGRQVDSLPIEEARTIVNHVLPRQGNVNSLFHSLESEGVLTVVPNYLSSPDDEWTESARFTYQRFSDHLIAKQLLARHLDSDDIGSAFLEDEPLGQLVKDEHQCRVNRGLLEALAIQVPEVADKELFEVAPRLRESRVMCEAFVSSLLWRDADSITEETIRYINEQVTKYQYTFEDFLDVQLTLATTLGHPLNALRLHKNLSRFQLADRDAWWSTFLHHEWGNRRAVDRLVEWAWSEHDKTIFDDEVIKLAGITLTWFLTTANRFLRDRATKALVRLCENRIPVLRELLKEFLEADDPYLVERLYAAAYGCAMRTKDINGLSELARDVYQQFFATDNVPPQILTRYYAKGTIEIAKYRCPGFEVDASSICPPYESDWPGIEIPKARELAQMREWHKDMPDEQWAKVHLLDSVMGQEDFSRYVIGSLDQWLTDRIGEASKASAADLHDEFVESLTARQKEAWDIYCATLRNVDYYHRTSEDRREETFGRTYSDEELDAIRNEARRELIARLRRNSKKCKLFEATVEAYVREPHKFYRENSFDGELGRRWMMGKIFDLGWTLERFGKFDRSISSKGRDARKAERIGKKYQWIAYYELLARLSDNFKLREDRWGTNGPLYEKPHDLGERPNVDPSNLLLKTQRDEWKNYTNTWWFPTEYNAWDDIDSDLAWLQHGGDLPKADSMLSTTDPNDNSQWLTLNGYYHWEQPTPVGLDRHDTRRREIWYMLKSYFIRNSDKEKIFEWAKQQSWMGRWMPESHASYDVFLGEFYWSHFFQGEFEESEAYDWTYGRDNKLPAKVLVANAEYTRETGGFDCSQDETISIYLPCQFVAEEMGLESWGNEGKWYDRDGGLVAFDPSVDEQGPSVLLIKKDRLQEFLAEHNLTLFWTLLGEKQMVGGSITGGDYIGHIEITGAYIWENSGLLGEQKFEFKPPPVRTNDN